MQLNSIMDRRRRHPWIFLPVSLCSSIDILKFSGDVRMDCKKMEDGDGGLWSLTKSKKNPLDHPRKNFYLPNFPWACAIDHAYHNWHDNRDWSYYVYSLIYSKTRHSTYWALISARSPSGCKRERYISAGNKLGPFIVVIVEIQSLFT